MVNGPVGQELSLSRRDHVQAFHVNKPPWFTPCSLTSSLTPSWSKRPISLSRSVWQYAYSLVLVFTIKNCDVFPQLLFILSILSAVPSPSVVLFLPFHLTQVPCAREDCLASPLWAPLVFGTLLSPAFCHPCAEASTPPREGGQVWLCEHAQGRHEKAR